MAIRYGVWWQNMNLCQCHCQQKEIKETKQADWDKCRVALRCFFAAYYQFLYTRRPSLCQENVKFGVGASLIPYYFTWRHHVNCLDCNLHRPLITNDWKRFVNKGILRKFYCTGMPLEEPWESTEDLALYYLMIVFRDITTYRINRFVLTFRRNALLGENPSTLSFV
jgi:hypothetical protein